MVLTDLLVHFVISLLLGLVLYLAYRRHFLRVMACALLVLLIDVDHAAFIRSFFGGVRIFHTLPFVTLVPATFMGYHYLKGRGTGDHSGCFTSALLLVMLTGHLFYDGMYGRSFLLFYPFNAESITISDMFLHAGVANTVNPAVAMFLYFAALVLLTRHMVVLMAEAEGRIGLPVRVWDPAVLFPVLDDTSVGYPDTGGAGPRGDTGLRICVGIDRSGGSCIF